MLQSSLALLRKRGIWQTFRKWMLSPNYFNYDCALRANEPTLSEAEQETLELERADRSLFVQDLILSTLGSAAFRRRPRPISSSTEPSQEFASPSLHESTGSRGEAAARDCNVIEQDITVQDMEFISIETEEEEDKDS